MYSSYSRVLNHENGSKLKLNNERNTCSLSSGRSKFKDSSVIDEQNLMMVHDSKTKQGLMNVMEVLRLFMGVVIQ